VKDNIAKKWIKSLTSGQYDQTKYQLVEDRGDGCAFCCLGVLGNELVDTVGVPFKEDSDNDLTLDRTSSSLSRKFYKAAGMKNGYGDISLYRTKKKDRTEAYQRLIKSVDSQNARKYFKKAIKDNRTRLSLITMNDDLGFNFKDIAAVIKEFKKYL